MWRFLLSSKNFEEGVIHYSLFTKIFYLLFSGASAPKTFY